jgi:hypothetical protein
LVGFVLSFSSLALLLASCRELLHQQEQRAAQLNQLLQKDVLIKWALTAYILGRCTYTQVSAPHRQQQN